MQIYYKNEPKFNGALSRSNLPTNKGWGIAINLDE